LLSDAEENNTKVIEANTEARKAQRDAVRDLNNQIINAKTNFMKEKGLYDDYDAQIIARMDKQTQDLADAELERGEVIQKITEGHIEKMFSIERHREDARKDLEIVGGKLRLKAGADMGNKMLELIKKVNNDALATESSYLAKRNKINDLASLELITLETARDNQAKEEKKKKEEEASKKRADAREKAKQEQIKAEEEAKKISEEYAKSRADIESSVLTQFEKDQKKRAQIAKDWNRSATEIDEMYNQIIQEGNLTTSEAIYTELEKRLQANADYYNQLIAEDDAAKKQLEQNMKTETDLMKKYNKTKLEIEALYEKAVKEGKAKSAQEAYAIVQQDLEDKKQAMDDEEAMLEEGKRQGIKIAGELAQWQLEASTQRMEAEFSKLDEMLEKQRLAILDNQNLTESQREATEKVFAERKRKLQIEQWKRQQQIAVNSAIINTALAIGNALATTKPFPAALIAAAGAAVSGGIQVAKIKSTPIPQFAEGTEFLEGAGTGTSDSIPAMLSRGERVVPARTNQDYFEGLSVIQNRLVAPELVNSLLTNLAENGGMLAAPSEAITNLEREFGIDYERLGKEFRRGQTQVSINLDEKGFTKHITQGLNRSTYHNQKFRFKK